MTEYTKLIELVVNDITRVITIPNNNIVLGVVGDIEVNKLMFKMPRYYCGFDMSEFTPKINYVTPNAEGNYYKSELEVIDDVITFTWLLTSDVTEHNGTVKFSISLYKKENGRVSKVFNSRSSVGNVLEGLNVDAYVTPEQQQTILDRLETEIREDIQSFVTEKEASINQQITEKSDAAIKAIDAKKNDVLSTISEDQYIQKIEQNAANVGSLRGDIDDLIVKEYYSNRVNENKTESGYYLSNTGLPVSDDTYSTTDYVDITGLSTIYLNLNTKHPSWKNSILYCLYDEQKTFIKRENCDSTGSAIDVTSAFSGYRFVRISYITAENSKVYVGDKTEYEPYGLKEKIIQPSHETVKARGDFDTLEYRLDDVDRRLPPNINTVLYFGDSLTQGTQDGTGVARESVMSTLLGNKWTVKNYGVGGEQSHTISARASGSWFYLDAGITIPSDGSTVDVTTKIHDEYGTQQNFGNGLYSSAYNGWDSVNPCYVNGIECTLQKANASAPITIKRNTIGDAIVINRPTRIHMNSETFKKNPVLILCLGQNEGFNRDADILIQQIKGIIEFFKSERYIVVGMPHSLSGYTWEAPINEALKKEFGKHYLDIEGYMKTPIYDADGETIISSYALSDAGLTPTEDDLTKISNNQYPTSIMFDGVHFNHYGYEIWANVEYKLGKDLGYWD